MSEVALMYFYETAMLGTMRLASDKIGVAVSSISRQIGQLEREYGMPLFERGRRTIKLTAAGELALEYYQARQADKDAFQNRLADLRNARTGSIALAVGEGFLNRSFTKIIEEYQTANPGIELSITSGSTSDVMRMILDDEAHIGLVFQAEEDPKIRLRASAHQPLSVICAPGHPLAAMDGVSMAELAEQPLCLPPKGFSIRRALATAEARQNTWLNPMLTTGSIHIMREMAKKGRCVTVLPAISVRAEIEDGILVARPITDGELEQTMIGLIHRVGRQLHGPPGRLMAVLEKQLRSWTSSVA
ncbi:LysR family transcriptional regulator [Altericroceibacterium endophyticum]|uniref:LysR family transcriptional regulator n=1 Tax=Altericroceibacterium endophyticum TaxID=1808508 RepID=A0A6I4T786_9SPHN|nr:LysR family transcriptional regulator [Altericroceibacterium endophyticum]MXO67034.1 LysR family transcriptional regulator [Altericroceibacterium endophyticum]